MQFILIGYSTSADGWHSTTILLFETGSKFKLQAEMKYVNDWNRKKHKRVKAEESMTFQ
jgi:hypothetical protein